MTEVATTGIVGNTQQAAAEATVAREKTKVAWQQQPLTHVVIGITLLIISYIIMTSLHWNFAWKLLAGAILIFAGGKLAASKSTLMWHWPNIIRGVGWAIIAITIMMSGLMYMLASGVNQIERAAASVAGVSTPQTQAEIDAAHKASVEEAKRQAELAKIQAAADAAARIAAEVEATRTYDASFTLANAGPCLKRYKEETDCKTVRFEAYTQYDHFAPPGHCVMQVGTGVEWIQLGDSGWHRYRALSPTLVQFFTAQGAKCG